MNLCSFTRENKDGSLEILVLTKLFSKTILTDISRNEVVEVLHSEPFLKITNIASRLGKETNEEDAISLNEIIQFFDIDYLDIIRKRLRNVGVTKYSLLRLFDSIIGEKEYDDLLSFIQDIATDKRFLKQWNKIQYILNQFYDLIYIFDIDMEIIKYNDEESELIPVEVDDSIKNNDLIIKFENFKNR
jgi:PAS domain-containing protein